MENQNTFNHSKIYEKELVPLINEMKKICALNKIPFFTCVAVSNTDTKTKFAYDGILPGYLDLELSDNQFAKHLCIANGFDIKPIGAVNDFSDVTDYLANMPENMFESYTEEIIEEE